MEVCLLLVELDKRMLNDLDDITKEILKSNNIEQIVYDVKECRPNIVTTPTTEVSDVFSYLLMNELDFSKTLFLLFKSKNAQVVRKLER